MMAIVAAMIMAFLAGICVGVLGILASILGMREDF